MPDQNLLRGAKSLADKIDTGMIVLNVTEDDLAKIDPILASSPGFQVPNMKISVYKNRRGRYKGIYLWCIADLGTCRTNAQFATNWRHELINIENLKIIAEDEPSAWDKT